MPKPRTEWNHRVLVFGSLPKTIVPFFNTEDDIPIDYNIGITDWSDERMNHGNMELSDDTKDTEEDQPTDDPTDDGEWSFKQCLLSLLFFFNVLAFMIQLLIWVH